MSSISTIVTSLPKRWKIDANSQPMMPPPSTTRRFGTSVRASRPVESTQRSRVEALDRRAERERPGRDDRRAEGDVLAALDTKIVFASVKRPVPLTHSTPFALKSEATPSVICLTTADFHSFEAPKSSSGSPVLTPNFAKFSSASLSANAVCTHAFVGMQPTRRQVPPSSGSFSMQATLAPSCAARIAAV